MDSPHPESTPVPIASPRPPCTAVGTTYHPSRINEPLGPRQELQPPVPIRKVDPKYFRSAIAEHVNGKVVIAGVLQTDGRIREIRILKGVDARLDLSAARALLKWEFVPAQRNGIPVEMDIIAEIPFLLAPEAQRK